MSTALRTYYRGHNLLAMRDHQAGQNRVYHFDHQGTTQALTDSTGAVTDRFAADAWGVQVKRTGTSINPHWYIGSFGYHGRFDSKADYVRARWLRPALGRWLSRDPISNPRVVYAYGDESPTRNVDPMGLWTCQQLGGGILVQGEAGDMLRVFLDVNGTTIQRATAAIAQNVAQEVGGGPVVDCVGINGTFFAPQNSAPLGSVIGYGGFHPGGRGTAARFRFGVDNAGALQHGQGHFQNLAGWHGASGLGRLIQGGNTLPNAAMLTGGFVPAYLNRNPRTVIGHQGGLVVLFVTRTPISLRDLANLLRPHFTDAYWADGGSSSELRFNRHVFRPRLAPAPNDGQIPQFYALCQTLGPCQVDPHAPC